MILVSPRMERTTRTTLAYLAGHLTWAEVQEIHRVSQWQYEQHLREVRAYWNSPVTRPPDRLS
jgi:hypothetical protein